MKSLPSDEHIANSQNKTKQKSWLPVHCMVQLHALTRTLVLALSRPAFPAHAESASWLGGLSRGSLKQWVTLRTEGRSSAWQF